ncbi:Hypothetical protein, putative, partial [Bodo saltans]
TSAQLQDRDAAHAAALAATRDASEASARRIAELEEELAALRGAADAAAKTAAERTAAHEAALGEARKAADDAGRAHSKVVIADCYCGDVAARLCASFSDFVCALLDYLFLMKASFAEDVLKLLLERSCVEYALQSDFDCAGSLLTVNCDGDSGCLSCWKKERTIAFLGDELHCELERGKWCRQILRL